LADESASICRTSATLDYKKLESRVKGEGLSFLTITLPQFGQEFMACLERGMVDASSFPGFSRKSGLPLFLGGFLRQVFDTSGVLLDDPSLDCIIAVRQLTLMFGKVQLPCAPHRVEAAIRSYVEVDQEVRSYVATQSAEAREGFRRVALLLFGGVNAAVDDLIDSGSIAGKHGPGATADRLVANAKWTNVSWTTRLEDVFPFVDHVLPSVRYWPVAQSANYLEPGGERPVRVIFVPKTLKTPRVIAIEPTCMQYMQQAISVELTRYLEKRNVRSDVNESFGMIGFKHQYPNREMARIGSIDGELSTVDLSDASDRVSVQHVEDLFWYVPSLLEGVLSVRSSKAEVQGRGVLSLSKYASMGSALTFPLEAMVFLTVVFLGIEKALGQPLTRRTIRSYVSRVRVYGDDIVVPTALVHDVISQLEAFGLKVNANKTYRTGRFRESCGGDYYSGHWVTPVRVRRLLPESRVDTKGVISAVSLRNQLYFAGYWRTVKWMDDKLAGMLTHYPTVHPESPLLGRHTLLPIQWEKVSANTHAPLTRGWVVHSSSPVSKLDGWGALRKCLSPGRVEPFQDVQHLQRQGRPQRPALKLRWRAPMGIGVSWLPSSQRATSSD
jgi:hypothetical protein